MIICYILVELTNICDPHALILKFEEFIKNNNSLIKFLVPKGIMNSLHCPV